MPLDVREPQEDELDALLLDPLRNVAARLLARRRSVSALDLRHEISFLKHESLRRFQAPEATSPR